MVNCVALSIDGFIMKNVRITSGKYRGRKIVTPGGGTHPMGERERIALFNMIVDALPGAVVLDAYAGSGALGIEALSRGAREVDFIEKNTQAARVISDNLKALGVLDKKPGREAENAAPVGVVYTEDVAQYHTTKMYDVILVDPPYDAFESIGAEHLVPRLRDGGIMVISHPGDAPTIAGIALVRSRSYAGATISIYVKS